MVPRLCDAGTGTGTDVSFRALRPEYLAKTDGNACAALLLDLFAERAPAESTAWLRRTLAELGDDLYGAFGRAAVRSALAVLIDRGLIEARHATTNVAWDRAWQYRMSAAHPTDIAP